jgi:RHS repeat-associated protein
VARKDGSGNVFYYFEEPAGRTRTVTNATGVACNEADYYLFGGEQTHGNTCNQNYHFAGMYRDSETGNDATQFRMYESNLGRWMSPDPVAGSILNPQSLNRYTYVLNNPVNLIDPLGLECTDVDSNGVMHCTVHAGSDDANTADDTVYVGTLDNIIDLINHGPSPFDSHPGNNRVGGSSPSSNDAGCTQVAHPDLVVEAALNEPSLANCLIQKFGAGTKVTGKNAPTLKVVPQSEIDTRSGTKGAVATYSARGRGSVFISQDWFNSPASSLRYLGSTYIHELGNILSEKRYGRAVFWPDWSRGPYDPRIREWDVDMGTALEECVFLGIVTQNGALYP